MRFSVVTVKTPLFCSHPLSSPTAAQLNLSRNRPRKIIRKKKNITRTNTLRTKDTKTSTKNHTKKSTQNRNRLRAVDRPNHDRPSGVARPRHANPRAVLRHRVGELVVQTVDQPRWAGDWPGPGQNQNLKGAAKVLPSVSGLNPSGDLPEGLPVARDRVGHSHRGIHRFRPRSIRKWLRGRSIILMNRNRPVTFLVRLPRQFLPGE